MLSDYFFKKPLFSAVTGVNGACGRSRRFADSPQRRVGVAFFINSAFALEISFSETPSFLLAKKSAPFITLL